MAVVAGLFDSQASATEAMDKLLTEGIEDLDTKVYSGGGGNVGPTDPGVIIPVVPNTSGTGTGMGSSTVPFAGAAFGGDLDWFNEMDEVERAFYHEGMREGATLALAKVDDEDAHRVRQLFRSFNARTYTKD